MPAFYIVEFLSFISAKQISYTTIIFLCCRLFLNIFSLNWQCKNGILTLQDSGKKRLLQVHHRRSRALIAFLSARICGGAADFSLFCGESWTISILRREIEGVSAFPTHRFCGTRYFCPAQTPKIKVQRKRQNTTTEIPPIVDLANSNFIFAGDFLRGAINFYFTFSQEHSNRKLSTRYKAQPARRQ